MFKKEKEKKEHAYILRIRKEKHVNEACQDIAHCVYSQLLDIGTMFRRTDTHMRAEA